MALNSSIVVFEGTVKIIGEEEGYKAVYFAHDEDEDVGSALLRYFDHIQDADDLGGPTRVLLGNKYRFTVERLME